MPNPNLVEQALLRSLLAPEPAPAMSTRPAPPAAAEAPYQPLGSAPTVPTPDLSAVENAAFLTWYEDLARQRGLSLNPDDPMHMYDYRGAWKEGVRDVGPEGHFPSTYKLPGHPTKYLQDPLGNLIDTTTGAALGPDEADDKLVENAIMNMIAQSENVPPQIRQTTTGASNKAVLTINPSVIEQMLLKALLGQGIMEDKDGKGTQRPLNIPKKTSSKGGDVSAEGRKEMKTMIIREARAAGLPDEGIATLLTIVDLESGFNPYAENPRSSAAGLGQFIKATGKAYGLDESNIFDPETHIKALIKLTQDNARLVKKRGKASTPEEEAIWTYKYHHDGPTGEYGGLAKAQAGVPVRYRRYLSELRGGDALEKLTLASLMKDSRGGGSA